MDSLKDMNRTTRKLTTELNHINNELGSLAEQVQNARKNLRESLFLLMLYFVFCWTIGIYYWDKPVSNIKFEGGPEVAVIVGIGLFIGIPIYYVREKRRIDVLMAEKSELEKRKQQLEEKLNMPH